MSNPAVIHSKLSFSARKRWKNCPDSVVLSAGLPDKESPAAREGTAAHTIAEFYVRQVFNLPGKLPGDPLDIPVPEGVDLKDATPEEWNEELRKHGRAYAQYLKSLIPAGFEAHVTVEQKVAIPSLHAQLFGTADCLIWVAGYGPIAAAGLLIGADYKYGFQDVDVGDEDNTNEQLAAYGVAAAETFGLDPSAFKLAVFQPRRTIGTPGKHVDLPAEWLQLERAKLAEEVAAVEAADGTKPNPGPWCNYCRAARAGACPKVEEALAAATAVYVGERHLYNIPDDEIVQLWAMRTALKAFWEDVEGRIQELAKVGHPRIQIELQEGRRKWKDERAVTLTLLTMGRVDLLRPLALSAVYDRLPEFARADLVGRGAPPRSLKLVEAGTPSQTAKILKKYSKIIDESVKAD